jgi:chemotaxis protein CheC
LPSLTDPQLDALREIANIGSGNASTALAQTIGTGVDISVPNTLVLPLAEAITAIGPAETPMTGILLGITGDLSAAVLLLTPPSDAQVLYGTFGLEAGSEMAESALAEIGNIVGTAYINALAAITGFAIEPTPPAVVTDMLGAIVSSVLLGSGLDGDRVLLLDTELTLEGDADCAISFVLVPNGSAIDQLLAALGVA